MNITSLIFGPVPYLVKLYADLYLQEDIKNSFPLYPDDYNLPQVETFEFIIVGAGSAGSVIANRLSEKFNVLLLDAGGEPPPQTYVPAFATFSRKITPITFPYKTVPMKNSAKQDGGIITTPVGRVLGGSGSINFMYFNRGSPHDYDNWANFTGDPSWQYKNLLPLFKLSEQYKGEFPSDQHGKDGLLPISAQKYSPGLKPWLEAAAELNYTVRKDPSGPQTIGFGTVEFNKNNGRRVSTYVAFVKPFLSSRNCRLKLLPYAYVNEILLDDKKTAIGVKYTRHGVPLIALASKEVIVSAGSYGSPQLLMRSGIGPRQHLLQAKIDPKVNLPAVGKYLQEHVAVFLSIAVNNRSSCEKAFTEDDVEDFLKRGKGPLTGTSVFNYLNELSGQGYIASSRAVQEEGFPDWADLQYGLYAQDFTGSLDNRITNPEADYSQFHLLNTTSNDSSSGRRKDDCPTGNNGNIYLNVYCARPRSRGSLKLNTTNTTADPIIDLGYFNDKSDIKVLIEGIKKGIELFEFTKAYRAIGAHYPSTPYPGCESFTLRSDEYWDCFIRYATSNGDHPIGTCRMGKSKVDAVVDSKLRVFGVKNLRVVDASIMPFIINTNLQAGIIVIAQKASSDIIKQYSTGSSATESGCGSESSTINPNTGNYKPGNGCFVTCKKPPAFKLY